MRRGKEAERQQERKFMLLRGHTVTNSGNGHESTFRRRGCTGGNEAVETEHQAWL